MPQIACVDLFCGAGGLTHGFVREGVPVVAGIDLDPACRFPFETNNDARFLERDIATVTPAELQALYGDADVTILAGCAPCQPFSTYAQRYALDGKDGKWGLLYEFARLSEGAGPDVITMENVPTVAKHAVFHDFVGTLRRLGYEVWFDVVDSSRYGVPQVRRRMVLLASKHGEIRMIEPTHAQPKTVRQAIGRLRALHAGESAPRGQVACLFVAFLEESRTDSRFEAWWNLAGLAKGSGQRLSQGGYRAHISKRLWSDGMGQACAYDDNPVSWIWQWSFRSSGAG